MNQKDREWLQELECEMAHVEVKMQRLANEVQKTEVAMGQYEDERGSRPWGHLTDRRGEQR